jgi:hypothetical protein
MSSKKNKNRVYTFRLTEEESEIFEEKLQSSAMTKSEFFREIFIKSNVNLTVKAAPNKDYSRLIFIYNKSSNNLNQIALNINKANRNGIISSSLYQKTLNELISIRELFLRGINNAD